jgi:D-glycero-alpha-D-manno-heptose-7-phosphate kinase
MIANTDAQAELNAALVGADAQTIIDIARRNGAIGWKVNGAGGEGGSITLLCGNTSSQKRALIREIEAANPLFKNIPVYLSRFGLRIWDHVCSTQA